MENEELEPELEPKQELKQILKKDEKGRFLPGGIPNPWGRPKGKTLKEYLGGKYRDMSDEEKEEFLKDIGKEFRWRMAEGNPRTDIDVGTAEGLPFMIKIIKDGDTSSQTLSETV